MACGCCVPARAGIAGQKNEANLPGAWDWAPVAPGVRVGQVLYTGLPQARAERIGNCA